MYLMFFFLRLCISMVLWLFIGLLNLDYVYCSIHCRINCKPQLSTQLKTFIQVKTMTVKLEYFKCKDSWQYHKQCPHCLPLGYLVFFTPAQAGVKWATPGSICRWLLSLYSIYTTVAVHFLPDSIVQGLAVIKRNFMVKSHFSLKWSYNGVSLFVLKVTQK